MITVVLFIIKNIPERQNSLAHNNVLALAEDKQGLYG